MCAGHIFLLDLWFPPQFRMSAGGDSGQKGPAVSAQEAQMQAIMQQARVTVHTQTHHTAAAIVVLRHSCFYKLASSANPLTFSYCSHFLKLRYLYVVSLLCFYNLFYHYYFSSFTSFSNSQKRKRMNTHEYTYSRHTHTHANSWMHVRFMLDVGLIFHILILYVFLSNFVFANLFSSLCPARHARPHRSDGFDWQARPSGRYHLTAPTQSLNGLLSRYCSALYTQWIL